MKKRVKKLSCLDTESKTSRSPWFIDSMQTFILTAYPGLRFLVLFLFFLGQTTREKRQFLSRHGTLGKAYLSVVMSLAM